MVQREARRTGQKEAAAALVTAPAAARATEGRAQIALNGAVQTAM